MISGLAKSEVMPREQEVFATGLSFLEQDEAPVSTITTSAAASYYSKKKAKKNRTNR